MDGRQYVASQGILIVDDDWFMAQDLATLLTRHGFRCDVVHQVRDALDVLASLATALVVSDWDMWPLSGMDLLIAMDQRDYVTPVIVMTASAAPVVATTSRFDRVAAVLPKPISPGALVSTVGRVLHRGVRG